MWVVGIFVGVLVVLLIIGAVVEQTEKPRMSNDAERLISICGQPTKDDSTEFDIPRPIIPSRIIEYKPQKLRFMFIPAGGSIGDPPPYGWKLIGITDMTAKDPSQARLVDVSEAVSRMPCWAKR